MMRAKKGGDMLVAALVRSRDINEKATNWGTGIADVSFLTDWQ